MKTTAGEYREENWRYILVLMECQQRLEAMFETHGAMDIPAYATSLWLP